MTEVFDDATTKASSASGKATSAAGKAERPVSGGSKISPRKSPATVIWTGIAASAALLGFIVGQYFPSSERFPPTITVPGHKTPALVLNEFTVSDAVNKAKSWTVAVEVDGPSQPQSTEHVVPTLDPIEPNTSKAVGAGVILSANGYILTSNHVVQAGDKITVQLDSGLNGSKKYAAVIVGQDPTTDLALIKIAATNLPTASFAEQAALPGQWAIAIGSPMHLSQSVSLGIISAVKRNISGPAARVELIQTDAAINPGNSGGPLLNLQGQALGINTAMRQDAQNIGFAVPIDVAQKIAAKLSSNKLEDKKNSVNATPGDFSKSNALAP